MNENIYLKKAHIKDYKSIQDAKVEFKNGLNIIIGKNGSGKSNLINFLYNNLNFDFANMYSASSKLELINNKKEVISISTKENNEFDLDNFNHINQLKNFIITNNGNLLFSMNKSDEISNYLNNNKYNYDSIKYIDLMIKHGLPNDLSIIKDPLSFSRKDNSLFDDNNKPHFIRVIFPKLYPILRIINDNKPKPEEIEKKIISIFNEILFDKIKDSLKKFTSIKDIRLNNFSVVVEKNNILINNLYMEFKIDSRWYTFNNLSDGTQRIFYILSELLADTKHNLSGSLFRYSINPFDKIIFLEEPELGIHPHQLFKLMVFLKEQSQDKQIILTTHSPKCLDILDEDELDRILICSMTKKGTKIKNLTKEETKNAKIYLKNEAYLSDYWIHSDLDE
ncbi:MAG: AAA family ATPase [Cyanobacteriota bacterium]